MPVKRTESATSAWEEEVSVLTIRVAVPILIKEALAVAAVG